LYPLLEGYKNRWSARKTHNNLASFKLGVSASAKRKTGIKNNENGSLRCFMVEDDIISVSENVR
jgi:hypothetical protein